MASIFKQKYTIADENGKRIRKQSQCWYIDYKTAEGTRKRVKAFKDKQATAQLAAKLEKESELAQAGIADKYKEHRKRPLAEHLSDFRKSLGDTTKHARQTENALKKTFESCRFRMWDDIQASRFYNCLNKLKNGGEISQRTFNFYLKAGKQFCRWMVNDQRAGQSPLEHLKGKTITERKRQRRAVDLDEIRRLLETTEAEPERFGMTGHQRAVVYRLAIETGLRASELKSLTVSSFDFDNCKVTIRAANAKNKKTTELDLRKETAKELEAFVNGKLPSVQVFNIPEKTANMIKKDLEAAGIDYQDETGRYFDFHALRGELGTLLAASGTHPKVAQSIMRHSDINLTMSLYTHTLRGQESEAIENLPDLSLPSRKSQRATGTDDAVVESAYKPAYKKLTKKADFEGNSMSLIGSSQAGELSNIPQNVEGSKSLQMTDLETKKDRLSSPDVGQNSNGRYRTRTCDPLIKSQLLCQLS